MCFFLFGTVKILPQAVSAEPIISLLQPRSACRSLRFAGGRVGDLSPDCFCIIVDSHLARLIHVAKLT